MSENSTVAVSDVSPPVITTFAKPQHQSVRASGTGRFADRQQRRQFHRSRTAGLLGLSTLAAMILAVHLVEGGWTMFTVGVIPAAYLLTDELLSRREVVATCSSDAFSGTSHTTPDVDLPAQRWPNPASATTGGKEVASVHLPVQCHHRPFTASTTTHGLARIGSKSSRERLHSSLHGRQDRRR